MEKTIIKFLKRFWPIFIIIFVWFIFSAPYFLKHKVPYPSDYQINSFNPWSAYPELLGPVKNSAMSDVIDQIYPWKYFTISQWKKGSVPLWNPYSFTGNAHLANYQSAVFSPFNLLYFIFPFVDAWSIAVLLQPLIAGLSMYLFLRRIKVTKLGVLIGSATCMFSGFMVVWMAYGTLSMAISVLPLSLFAVESYFETKKVAYLILLFLTIPFSLFSGHFQTSIYFLLFLFGYIFFRGITTKQYRQFLQILLTLALGIGASSIQLIPSIELYSESVRSSIFRKTGGIPLQYIFTIFSPDYYGNPVTRNDWFGYYAEWSSFVGILPLFFSSCAFFKRKNIHVIFFGATFFISLILALQTPLDTVLEFLKIPVLSTSSPSRIIILASFSIAVLAGIGFDIFVSFLQKKKLKSLIPSVVFISLFLIVAIIFPIISHFSHDHRMTAWRNLVIPITFFGITIFLLTLFKQKKSTYIILFIVVCFAVFNSLQFASKWMPFEKKDDVFKELPVITAMKKSNSHGRIFGNFGAYVDTYYGIRSMEGNDPLYEKRIGEFITSARLGKPEDAERSNVILTRHAKYIDRVLDLLDAEILYHPILDTKKTWAYPVWQDKNRFKVIYQDTHFQLYKNNSAIPRASLFYNYDVVGDKDALKHFYSDTFDFRRKIILPERPSEKIEQGSGTSKIMIDDPNKIVIQVSTTTSALLFLSDTHYPGWQATIDSKNTKIYRADYAFRAVFVPTGTHQIIFTYRPQSFSLGIFFSGLSLVVGGLLLFLKKP